MFTGIIHSLGNITACSPLNGGLDVWIQVTKPSIISNTGDSISVNGVCSTIIESTENSFRVHYLEETLKKKHPIKSK